MSDDPDPRYRIRRARAIDAGPISKVHVAAWQESYRGLIPDDVLDNLSWRRRRRLWSQSLSGGQGRGAVYVAESDTGIVGFTHAGPTHDEGEDSDRHATLFAIYLLNEVKRKGLGTKLLEQVLSTIATNGFRSVSLWVLEANTEARLFYEALGWKTDGRGKETFGIDQPVQLATIRYSRSL